MGFPPPPVLRSTLCQCQQSLRTSPGKSEGVPGKGPGRVPRTEGCVRSRPGEAAARPGCCRCSPRSPRASRRGHPGTTPRAPHAQGQSWAPAQPLSLCTHCKSAIPAASPAPPTPTPGPAQSLSDGEKKIKSRPTLLPLGSNPPLSRVSTPISCKLKLLGCLHFTCIPPFTSN